MRLPSYTGYRTPSEIKRMFGGGSWNNFVRRYPRDADILFSQCFVADLGRAYVNLYLHSGRKELRETAEGIRSYLEATKDEGRQVSTSFMGSTTPDVKFDGDLNWRSSNWWDNVVKLVERD